MGKRIVPAIGWGLLGVGVGRACVYVKVLVDLAYGVYGGALTVRGQLLVDAAFFAVVAAMAFWFGGDKE